MIDLYSWTTPNGRKASIMLEELGMDYEVHPVDIGKDEQFAPDFLKISPNNKIPAIVDHVPEGGGPLISVFESGAICTYLAQKARSPLLGETLRERIAVSEWTFFQMANIGPMLGQLGHFLRKDERIPYAVERYANEARRLFGVVERRLADHDYLAGDFYSIADICSFPWLQAGAEQMGPEGDALHLGRAPAVRDYLARIGQRPAVRRGMAVPRRN